jgi:hypothetical protein
MVGLRFRGRRRFPVAAIALAALAAAPAAHGASFTVDSTVDTGDANVGDGACDADPGAPSPCTLRAGIQETNGLAGQDELVVPAGDYGIGNFFGILVVTGDLIVNGAGSGAVAIHPAPVGSQSILRVDPGGALDLRGVTLSGGANTSAPQGGAITSAGILVVRDSVLEGNTSRVGGAIRSDNGVLTIERTTIRGNLAESPGSAEGGGVYAAAGGDVQVSESVIADNTVRETSAGLISAGGGISSESPLTIRDSVVSGNTAVETGAATPSGGGLVIKNGGTIERTSIEANSSGGSGGGLVTQGAAGSVTSIRDSTFSGNSATGLGGGIFASRPVVVFNSTMTVNFTTSPGSRGGAAFVSDGSALAATHATFAGNASSSGDAIFNDATGGGFLPPVLLRASIFEGPGPLCAKSGSAANPFSGNFNVVEDASCNVTMAGDRPSTVAGVAPLADNGGPTRTHAIDTASPALDIVTSNCPPPAADQRGVVRPAFAACDAGSFEFSTSAQGEPPPTGDPPGVPGGSNDDEVRLEVEAKGRQRLKRLAVVATCPQEACDIDAGGKVTAKPSRKGSNRVALAKRKVFKLRDVARALLPGVEEKLRLKLKRKPRRKLAALIADEAKARAKVVVTAADASGNEDVERLKVRLRR